PRPTRSISYRCGSCRTRPGRSPDTSNSRSNPGSWRTSPRPGSGPAAGGLVALLGAGRLGGAHGRPVVLLLLGDRVQRVDRLRRRRLLVPLELIGRVGAVPLPRDGRQPLAHVV